MTSKIKILHITYDMRIGGTEQVIVNLIKGSDLEQFEMSILCIESPLGPFADDLLHAGIEITSLVRQPGFDTSLIKQIRSHIKQNDIQIVHCHQYTPYVYGVLGALMTPAKVIFTEHGRFYPDTSSWKRKLINPILNKFTAHVTAISEATKQALVDFENIPAKDIKVIYNGIAPLQFEKNKVKPLRKALNIPENHKVLGTVARFDPIKNHIMMIKAFAKVLTHQPNCSLLIVGDGEERSNIEKCITELDINNNVILAGYQTKPAEHIILMDIFLLSSLSEGTSMTLLEAMSIGKPCVVTDAGGNPEIIKQNINGKVTPNDNSAMFADAIIEILEEQSKCNSYAQSSIDIFNQKFVVNSMSEKYKALYLTCQ